MFYELPLNLVILRFSYAKEYIPSIFWLKLDYQNIIVDNY